MTIFPSLRSTGHRDARVRPAIDYLTDAQATAAAATLTEDLKRHLTANRAALVSGPGTIDFSCQRFQQDVHLLVRMLHRREMLTETLRRARAAKQAAAQSAALARAKRILRSRLPTLLSRARQRRSTRRPVQRIGPPGRKRRHRSSPDDPGDIAARSGSGGAP
jgi:hypothetical protein